MQHTLDLLLIAPLNFQQVQCNSIKIEEALTTLIIILQLPHPMIIIPVLKVVHAGFAKLWWRN